MRDTRSLRPFLKWVGGKRQLLPQLRRYYPDFTGRYFEPFVGSGAVFFDLMHLGRLEHHDCLLSDDNPDLIGCYSRLRDSLGQVIAELQRLNDGHTASPREHYLRVRDDEFNPLRAAWLDAGGAIDGYTAELAARFVYLNRTGYNGLFRLNASGYFNVPPGRYDRPKILNRELLESAAAALSRPNVQLVRAQFEDALASAGQGDFVYFDPPYAPLSPSANFRSYTAKGFRDEDQERLQRCLISLAERGVHVLLSNSTAPVVARLYETSEAAFSAGLRTIRVPARRSINSRADRRGAIDEMVVSNVVPRSA